MLPKRRSSRDGFIQVVLIIVVLLVAIAGLQELSGKRLALVDDSPTRPGHDPEGRIVSLHLGADLAWYVSEKPFTIEQIADYEKNGKVSPDLCFTAAKTKKITSKILVEKLDELTRTLNQRRPKPCLSKD